MSDNPEDYELVHYGVKGMKWGQKRADKKAARQKQDEDIMAARTREAGRANKLDQKHNKAIDAFLAGDQDKSDRLMKQAQKIEFDALNHPDNKVAHTLTSGEKKVRRVENVVTAVAFAGMTAAVVIGSKGR